MADLFESYSSGLESPPSYAIPVVPSDTVDHVQTTRAINVASAGTVQVTTVGGNLAQVYVAAGVAFPLRVTRVWATGTDASGIVGLC